MKNDIFSVLEKKSGKTSETAVKRLTEIFGLDEDVKVITIPISSLKEKENHPFKVIEDDKLNALAESIRENGLMEPIIVRPVNNGIYEILAGHRRTRACRLLGKTEINAIVVKVNDEVANRIMISTNFQQRDCYLPSEIAKSYLIRYNDLQNRRKLAYENSNGWNSDEKIEKIMEKEFLTSKSKVYMYLRLNYLCDELLGALDNKKINLKTAVELSYLTYDEQYCVYDLVYCRKLHKLDFKTAALLKKESSLHKLDEQSISDLLGKSTEMQKSALSFSVSEINKYKNKFESVDDMRKTIIDFLEKY